MYKKLSIGILLIALLVLAGIFVINKYTGSEDLTFRDKVLSYNSELVNSLIITDYQSGEKIKIVQEEGVWNIYSEGKVYGADPDAIKNAIAMLNQLKIDSIASTKAGKWADYKVDEKEAIHIFLYQDDNLVGDLFIGKFDFKQLPPAAPGRQPETKITSYVRLAGENKVYAVNGLLRSNFQGGKNPFRNRLLFQQRNHLDINKVTIKGSEKKLVLNMSTPVWTVNGIPLDSTKTDRYLRSLSRLWSSNFIDEVDVSKMAPAYTLMIEGNTFAAVTLTAFPADSVIGYYVSSSANEGAVFNGSKARLFEKTFVGSEAFLPEE
ncbi:MAG: DUF4340 domain-containing protein [Bacteroidetes bacterium]|nr:DUF4340 domain-containing protein [Bacteroidota bacterium]